MNNIVTLALTERGLKITASAGDMHKKLPGKPALLLQSYSEKVGGRSCAQKIAV